MPHKSTAHTNQVSMNEAGQRSDGGDYALPDLQLDLLHIAGGAARI
jgi:hypothetical protein